MQPYNRYDSTSERPYCIYTLSNKGIIFYVGKTSIRLNERLNGHVKHNTKVINYCNGNTDAVTIECLEACDQAELKFLEVYWINQLTAWGFCLINAHYTKHIKLPKISKRYSITTYH